MKRPPETDPALRLIDAVLADLAVRTGMHVARRREDGDGDSFVIQTGEEGRCRLALPDLKSDASLETLAADAQAHLARALGGPVPRCPLHPHALVGTAVSGHVTWVCPDALWQCGLGDYEERTWPQLDMSSLAPILARRLHRRGTFSAVRNDRRHRIRRPTGRRIRVIREQRRAPPNPCRNSGSPSHPDSRVPENLDSSLSGRHARRSASRGALPMLSPTYAATDRALLPCRRHRRVGPAAALIGGRAEVEVLDSH